MRDYTPEIADTICDRLADGESLRAICAGEDMPNRSAVFRWLNDNEAFRNQYARAREEQADTMADEIVGISDENAAQFLTDDDGNVIKVAFDSAAVARNRLRVDARKWVASKLKPKKYGDRQVLAGDPDAPLVTTSDAQLDARLNELMARMVK